MNILLDMQTSVKQTRVPDASAGARTRRGRPVSCFNPDAELTHRRADRRQTDIDTEADNDGFDDIDTLFAPGRCGLCHDAGSIPVTIGAYASPDIIPCPACRIGSVLVKRVPGGKGVPIRIERVPASSCAGGSVLLPVISQYSGSHPVPAAAGVPTTPASDDFGPFRDEEAA